MAKMKIEVLAARAARRGVPLREKLIAYLPRYAPIASRVSWLMNARDRLPGLPALSEKILGFSARRKLPRWASNRFHAPAANGAVEGPEVLLFADTFNTYFEPENLRAAAAVLSAAGYRVRSPISSSRPVCCGRTFLSVGLVEQARAEARRLVEALLPFAARGVPVVGLEPSCLFTLRDELPSMLPGKDAKAIAAKAMLFEEFLTAEMEAGRFKLDFAPADRVAYLHGHCHQKAFGVMPSVESVLGLIPGLAVKTIASSCCGMAGAFGYQAETYEVSMRMGELSLLPAMRKAEAGAIIVADGTSCRQQIADGAGRQALHVARVLEAALSPKTIPGYLL
jgi:Fe-S oxidoreductase